MQKIDVLAAQSGTSAARRSSLDVLQAITVEFSPLTSSPMGLPWDYHEQCRLQLQEEYLFGFMQHAMEIARQSAGAAVAGGDPGVCEASLSLLSSVLCWEHAALAAGAGGNLAAAAGGAVPFLLPPSEGHRSGNADMHVRPPFAWRELLLDEVAFTWLADLDAALRTVPGLVSSPLAQAVRQVEVQLASMSGEIFVKEGDRQGLGLNHILHQSVLPKQDLRNQM